MRARLRQAIILVLISCAGAERASAQQPRCTPAPPGSERTGAAFTFDRIQDDIYHAVGTGTLAVGANAAIIINAADVLIVDSHISPAAACVLLQELKAITQKPVRYVVNTHFHFDHVHGNQIFPADVEIVGHEFTHQMIASGQSMRGRGYDRFVSTLPAQVEALSKQIDTTSAAARKDSLQRRLAILRSQIAASGAVVPTAPTVTLSHRMTLFRGGREIRLLFLGRGHTAGDVVVLLPRERVVVTGDMLTGTVPFMGDAYVNEWAETLEQLKRLEFDVVLPGHGRAFRDRARIDHLQAYLRDLWPKVVALHAAGVPAEEAARRIDMRSHAPNYSGIRDVGVDVNAVLRIYELLGAAK